MGAYLALNHLKKIFFAGGRKGTLTDARDCHVLFLWTFCQKMHFSRFSHTVPRSALSQTSTWKPLCFVNTKDSRKRKMRKMPIFYGQFCYFWPFLNPRYGHFADSFAISSEKTVSRCHIRVRWFRNYRFLPSDHGLLKVFSSEWQFRKFFHYKP